MPHGETPPAQEELAGDLVKGTAEKKEEHKNPLQPENTNQVELERQIRGLLYIFTETGRAHTMIEHGRTWDAAMDKISRLRLTTAEAREGIAARVEQLTKETDSLTAESTAVQEQIANIAQQAKAIMANVLETRVDVQELETIRKLRALVETNTNAKEIVLAELQRIRREDLIQEILPA